MIVQRSRISSSRGVASSVFHVAAVAGKKSVPAFCVSLKQ